MPRPSLPEPDRNGRPDSASEFEYRIIDESNMDSVQPLWLKLRDYHARLPWRFADEMHGSPFEPRKQELLAKAVAGKLRIELACTLHGAADIAYCISTVSADGRGEVDSLFVDEGFRGRGVGSELLRHALAWLESAGVTSKLVSVAHGNEEALALYNRFGFHPRTIVLQQERDERRM